MMSETTRFTIGNAVLCNDGVCGHLRRVVVDPIACALTHLVVEPGHGATGRLVPVGLVDSADGWIRLRCSHARFERLEAAEETRFLPGGGGDHGYRQGQMVSWPYYGLGPGGGMLGGVGGLGGRDLGPDAGSRTITRDRVPVGEVQVRRGEHVHATDGAIGRVRGLVIDRADHHVTHVLLDEGHLWGHKQVAIPIGSVTGVEDGVRLDLTKDEVRDLPPIDLDPPQ